MGYRYDSFRQLWADQEWQNKLNQFISAAGADMDWAVGQIGVEENIMFGVPTGLTYSDNNTFTITGNLTAKFAIGTLIILDLGADGLVSNEVASSSYAAPTTTVNLARTNLTNKLQCVYTLSTRPGTFPNRWMVNAVDYGIVGDGEVITGVLQAGYTDNSAALQAAIDALPNGGTLVIARDSETAVRLYVFDTTLVSIKPVKIVFEEGVQLIYSGTGDALQVSSSSDSADWTQLIRPNIVCYNASQVGCGIVTTAVGRLLIDTPRIAGFKWGIKTDGGSGAPVSGGMYSFILNPWIEVPGATIAASGGIYVTGTNVSGCRPNLTKIFGRGSIWGAPVGGYGINIDLGAGHLIEGIELSTNLGWAIRLAGVSTYYQTGTIISKNWFDTNGLGSVFFDTYAAGNIVKDDNLFRTATDRKIGGTWAPFNILKLATTPSSTAFPTAGNVSRDLFPYNNPMPNELPNGGWLLEDPEYAGCGLGWTKGGLTNNPVHAIKLDGTPPDDCERYLRITSIAGGNTARQSRYIKLKPGRLVTIGLWMRTSVSQIAQLRVGYASDDDYYANLTNSSGVVDTWEYVSVSLRFPRAADGDYVSNLLRLTCYNNSNDGTTCDFGPIQVNYGNVGGDYQEHPSVYYYPLRHCIGTVNTQSVTVADLRSITIKAGMLPIRGGIEIEWSGRVDGTTGAGADSKEVKIYWGTDLLCTLDFAQAITATEWLVRAHVENTAAAVQRITVLEVRGATDPVFELGSGANLYQAGAQNTAANVVIKATGKVINAADTITHYTLTVKPLTPWYSQALSGV